MRELGTLLFSSFRIAERSLLIPKLATAVTSSFVFVASLKLEDDDLALELEYEQQCGPCPCCICKSSSDFKGEPLEPIDFPRDFIFIIAHQSYITK
jgi:hypothetical protein